MRGVRDALSEWSTARCRPPPGGRVERHLGVARRAGPWPATCAPSAPSRPHAGAARAAAGGVRPHRRPSGARKRRREAPATGRTARRLECGWPQPRRWCSPRSPVVVPLVRERTSGTMAGAATAASAVAPSSDELVQNVAADLAAAEAHYQKAIAGLEQIAQSESGDLDPQVAAVLQTNLQVDRSGHRREPRGATGAAVERAGAGEPFRRHARQGVAAPADGGADQRDAEGQPGRGRAPDEGLTGKDTCGHPVDSSVAAALCVAFPAGAAAGPRGAEARARGRRATTRPARAPSRPRRCIDLRRRQGRHVDLTNVAGDVRMTGGSGSEIRIDAVKRVRRATRRSAPVVPGAARRNGRGGVTHRGAHALTRAE